MRSQLRIWASLVALGGAAVLAGAGGSGAQAPLAPVEDPDGDGIVNGDRCPDRPGLAPAGCPPSDWDGDWVVDSEDLCPRRPGPRAGGGCPDVDSDGDLVVDRGDRCADEFGHPHFDGCPPADSDRDSVADPLDQCEGEREVWNGRRDGDGCADPGAAVLVPVERGLSLLKVAPQGALSRSDRVAIALAAQALETAMAREVRVEVVADHGLSYGHSIGRARRRASLVAAHLRKQTSIEVIEDPLGPDGTPRVVLRYR